MNKNLKNVEVERERERERESNNLEEHRQNININISSKDNPNCRGEHCSSVLQRNCSNNTLNNVQIKNKNNNPKTIENRMGCDFTSVLQRTNLKNTGITLIALIITIIILLILAGVTINFVLGENGILNKAKYASEKYTNAQTEENAGLDDIENKMDNIIQGGNLRRRFRRKRTSYIRWKLE